MKIKTLNIYQIKQNSPKSRQQHKSTITYKELLKQPIGSIMSPIKTQRLKEHDDNQILDHFMQKIDKKYEYQREIQNELYYEKSKIIDEQLKQYYSNLTRCDFFADLDLIE